MKRFSIVVRLSILSLLILTVTACTPSIDKAVTVFVPSGPKIAGQNTLTYPFTHLGPKTLLGQLGNNRLTFAAYQDDVLIVTVTEGDLGNHVCYMNVHNHRADFSTAGEPMSGVTDFIIIFTDIVSTNGTSFNMTIGIE